jgi:hypothetical protein
MRDKLDKKIEVSSSQAVNSLRRIATASLNDYEVDPETGKLIVINNEPEAVQAVESVDQTITEVVDTLPDGTVRRTIQRKVKIKLCNKIEAWKDLSKLLGWEDKNKAQEGKGATVLVIPFDKDLILKKRPQALPMPVPSQPVPQAPPQSSETNTGESESSSPR